MNVTILSSEQEVADNGRPCGRPALTRRASVIRPGQVALHEVVRREELHPRDAAEFVIVSDPFRRDVGNGEMTI